MELTNLDICIQLAEIEGLEYRVCEDNKAVILPQKVAEQLKINWVFNPLVDDRLCFQLMTKHGVHYWENLMGCPCAEVNDSFDNELNKNIENPICQSNPNWAICMAIIQAKSK